MIDEEATLDILTATVAQRPDLAALLGAWNAWPRFMLQDPVGSLYYADPVEAYPDFVLVAVDRDHPDQLVAKAYSAPFTWDEDPAVSLPDDGWDGVIIEAAFDRFAGRKGNLVSALEISIRPDMRGKGLSDVMLAAMRDNAAALGFSSLVAPVRPNGKHLYPDTSIRDYAALRRDDGLPVDPWLRVHVRAGGAIVGVSARAMTMGGSLEQWRDWTGLPFDTTGPVTVPEALIPVYCDVAQDYAVYCEPCIWVHHRLR
jgi:GNAT superfamily N-acetyltransferase